VDLTVRGGPAIDLRDLVEDVFTDGDDRPLQSSFAAFRNE